MNIMTMYLNYSERALVAICVLSFGSMFLLGVLTVVFRFLIQSSLAFPDELIRYLFVWLIALGTAVAFRRNLHASIELFVEMLPKKMKYIVVSISLICSALFMGILIVKGIDMTVRGVDQISPALEVSMAFVLAAVPAGATFTFIYIVELLIKHVVAHSDKPNS